jgi:hypothetical protein
MRLFSLHWPKSGLRNRTVHVYDFACCTRKIIYFVGVMLSSVKEKT